MSDEQRSRMGWTGVRKWEVIFARALNLQGVCALAIAALLGSCPALAVFTKNEMDVVDPEPLFDSRYFLDLLSFSYPQQWAWEWDTTAMPPPGENMLQGSRERSYFLPAANGYRINGASLDRSDLLLAQDVRIRRPFSGETGESPKRPWIYFLYDLRHEADKNVESFHQWLSIEAGSRQGWGLRVFGEPTFSKEDSDIGAQLQYRPRKGLLLYSGANMVDWNLNERAKTGQTYQRKPYTYESGITYENAGYRWNLSAELDDRTTRVDPSQNLTYTYTKTSLQARWDRPPSNEIPIGFGIYYRYEFKRESKLFIPDPASQTSDFQRQVHTLRGVLTRSISVKNHLEAGALAMLRRAATDLSNNPSADVRYTRWEVQPYGRWRHAWRPWLVGEAALFLDGGENRKHFASSRAELNESMFESKLGLGIDFVAASRGRIGLYGTFELDRMSRHLWGGGNARAQWLF